MKKMTKGAIVTGLGVALLLGGGGTLAVWNAEAVSTAGTIAAGDLNMDLGAVRWSSDKSGTIEEISQYRPVPGEELTFEQDLNITLEGDELKATVSTNAKEYGLGKDVSVAIPQLEHAGKTLPTANVLTPEIVENDKTVTAKTTFTFEDYENQGRSGAGVTHKLENVQYVLTQLAPTK
jgi:alternate signal-mediated exported protein